MKNRNLVVDSLSLSSFLTVAFFAATLWTARAANLVQEFYLPMPESQIYQANAAIVPGVGATNFSTFSIVVTGDGTVINYDQWEDGYEVNLASPVQSTTQIWGDGNNANGICPGFTNDPAGLPTGTVITLTNNVTLPRNPSVLLWDARDRIGANKALVISRAAWPVNPGPVFAGAAGVLSTIDYGTNYVSPVGQDMTNGLFKYVGMFVMAAQNNTAVTLDVNGNGVGTTNIVLNQGESYLINGGIKKGGRITASKPVQADLLVGHVGVSYASDWFTLYPVSAWDNTYYTPVATSASGNPAYVYLYNPSSNAITINYNTRVGSGSFSIPGTNGVFQFRMPVASGASFASAGGQNFFAICTVGANPSADTAYNWGFTLVPKTALTTEATVGWGPGSADGTVNGSPVWVTALAGTTLYVDYKGDHAGPLTDPNGKKYDTNFTMVALQSQKIFDPSKNQTGMRVYTVDGTLITAAWGEDPDTAQPGNPYIDAGTTVLPFPVPVLIKTATIVTDAPPTGLSIGDVIEYSVQIGNKGLLPLGNTVVIDAPSTNLTYVANSTSLDGNTIPDSPSGTAFPLDAPGYTIPVILSQGNSTFKYRVAVNASGAVSNSVNIGGTTISSATFLTPAPTNGSAVFVKFTDVGGVTTSAYSVGANVYVTLTNAIGNTSSNSVQTISVTVNDTNTLDLQTITLTETGVNTGVFRNLTGLPTSGTSGLGAQDGTLYVAPGDTLSVNYTEPTFGSSSSATAAISIPTPNKQLYLSVNNSTNGTQALNRIDPVFYGHGPIYTSIDIGQGGGGTTVASTIGNDGAFSTNKTTSPVTFNYTTGAGSNRLMLITVGVQNDAGSAPSVSGVTYGGTSLNIVASSAKAGGNPKYTVYVYALTNPPAGAAAVQVTWSGGNSCLLGVNTFTNVNQATPFNSTNTVAPGTSITVNSATNQLVYGTTYGNLSTNSLAGGQNATVRWATNFSTTYYALASTAPGSNSLTTTMTWTASAYAVGLSINPATTFIPNPGSGPATNVTSFAQAPVFASAFTMPAGGLVTITNFITITNGTLTSGSAVTATLQTNGVNFLTLTNPIYNAAGGVTNLVWTGTLANSVTIPAGAAINYVISNNVANSAFHVNYDSTNAQSVIVLPASTVIQIATLGIYDAPFPNGNLVTTPVAGSTLYVRSVVTDPFGSYDITSLRLAVVGPTAGTSFTNVLTGANVVTNDNFSKTYEYTWATTPTTGGFSIAATASEGTEGVTASTAASITTIFLDLGTPSTTEFTGGNNGTPTNSYLATSSVCIRVTDINRDTNAATAQTIIATVSSSSGDSEILTLNETGTNTGIFTACLNTSTNSNAAPNDGTLFAPVGSILTASYTDPTDTSDSTSATATIQPLPGVPGLFISKTIVSPSGGQVGVGQPVVYNLQIVNVGSTTLPSLKITDTFTASKLSFTSASATPDTVASGSLTWNNLGAFAPGQSTNITVNFTTLATGTATNAATANGSTATNSSSVTLAINSAALNVTKILLAPTNQPVAVGSNVTFRITIQNVGNTIINTLPFEDTYSGAYYQYVSATIPANGSGFGTLIWTNLAVPALGTNAIITNDVTMLVVGQGSPANNTATADFAFDIFGNPVPVASSTIGVTTASAGINGHVYNDINQSGVFTNGDTGLSAVTIQLFTDPNGDGDPSDGTLVQLTTTDGNGYYELLNLNLGKYVVVETDLAGYSSSAPVNNRLPLNITTLTTYTNNNFFDYQPAPSLYSTFSGTVYNDVLGTGTNTAQAGLAYVTIDLVQDVNSNGIADTGEPIASSTVTDTNGTYSLPNITPGYYVIRESDAFGYYSTGDSQAPNNNQISFATTNGIVSTNNSFFDRLSPVAVNDTNATSYFAPVTIYPLTNDVSPNGDALTITNATSAFGIVVINPGSTNLTFTPTNVGTATIIYTIADAHGGSSSATITVAVSLKPLTITANSTGKFYGQTITFAGTEFTAVGLTNGDSVSSVTLNSAGAVNTAIVGSYQIIPSAAVGSGLANYAITYATNGTLTVSPATLGVTANATNRLYNTANPAFTYTASGFVNGETASVLSGSPSLTTPALIGSAVGSYPIVATNGTLSATNYVIAFTNGTLTVLTGSYGITWTNPASITYGTLLDTNQNNAQATVAGSYVYSPTNGVVLPAGTNTLSVVFTPSDTNYAATNLSVSLVVTPAPLTVTANSTNKIYGATLTLGAGQTAFTSSGLVSGQTIGSVTLTSAGAASGAAAGTYAVVPSAATGGTFNPANYSLTYSNGVLTVNPATLTVTANSTNKIYGAANPTFTAGYGGFVNGDTAGVLTGSPSLTTTATTNSAAGGYPIVATNGTLSAANYGFTFVNGTLTIGQATLTVTANSTNRLYNVANPTFTASYTGFVNGDTASVLAGSPSLTTPALVSSPAGTYPIVATNGTLSAANYGFTFANGTLTISGGNYGLSWTNPPNIVYGTPLGTNQNNASATVGGSYAYNPTNGTVLPIGTNTLNVVFTPSDTNYASTNVSVALVVTPAPLTITANSTNKFYGTTLNLGTTAFTTSGLVNGDSVTSVTLTSSGTATNAGAGSYTIVPSLALGSGLTNYSLAYSNGTLTINKAGLTVTANNTNKIYGAANPAFTASYGGFVNGETVGVLSGAPSLTTTATTNSGAGVYPIAATNGTLSSANYSFTFVNGTLTVGQATLTVTANSTNKIYGAANPTFTASYSGFANGDTAGVLTGTPSLTTTATTNSGVGGYTITATNGTLSAANYAFTFANGTLTIGQAALTVTANNTNKIYGAVNPTFTASYGGFVNGETVGVLSGAPSFTTPATTNSGVGGYTITATNGTLSAANYAFTFANGTLTIGAATLTVTANSTNRIYGVANPAFTASYNGFVNGETTSVLSGAPSLTTPALISSPAGTYPITATNGTLSAANYGFSFVSGTLTVVGGNYGIIWTNPANVVYGTLLGTNQNNASATVPGSYVYNPTNGTLLAAGTNTLAVVFTPSDTNYATTNVSVQLIVTPAPLTITANSTNKLYNTTLTLGTTAFTSSGLVNGQTIGGVTLSSAGAVSSAPVGTYPITPSSATGGTFNPANYSLTYSNGTLTVLGAGYTATWPTPTNIIYGTPLGTNQNNATTSLPGTFTYNPTNGVILPAVTNTLTVLFTPSDTNYATTNLSVSLVVLPAPVTITANSTNKLYNTTLTLGTTAFASSGLVNGDTVTSVTLVSTGAAGVAPVGTYPIIPSAAVGSGLTNYSIAYSNGTLTVLSGNYGIAWTNPPSIVYGTPLGTNENNASATVPGGYVYNPTNGTVLSVGTNTLSVVFTPGDTNYVATNLTVSLVVTPAPLSITASNAARLYGQANPSLGGTVTGIQNGDNITATYASVATTNSPVGNYPIIPTLADPNSRLVNYSVTTNNGTLTVGAATLTVTANSTNRLYNIANPSFTASYSGFVNGETAGVLTGSPSLTTTALISSPAGGYPITATNGTLSATNYAFSFVNGTLTVLGGNYGITWTNPPSIVYGTLLDTNQNNAIATVPGTFTYDPTNGVVLPVGTNLLSVIFTPTDTNYAGTNLTVSLVVTPAPLIVTADSANKVYGTTLTLGSGQTAFTSSGLVNGDTVTSVTLTSAGAAGAAAVGTYPIVPSVAVGSGLTNYSLTYSNGTLTVNLAAPLVVWPTPTNIIYGTPLGTNENNATSTTPGTAVYNPTNGTVLPVGTNTLSVVYTPTDTNFASTNLTVPLIVTPAALTVTGSNVFRVYGQPNPVLGGSLTGVVNGDNITATFATLATSNSPAGAYPIVPTLADPNGLLVNYSVTTNNGTLTVTPAILGITANPTNRLYGAANPVFTYTASGFVLGDTASVLSGTPSLTTTAVTNSPVGTYAIAATNGTLSATNYSFSFTNGLLSVNLAAPLVLWPTPTNIVYGTPLGTNQNNATSTVPGSLVYTPTNGTVLPVGTNTLSVVYTPTDTNFASTNLTVPLIVTPAALTVTANDAARAFGQPNPVFTGSLTGVVNGDNITATYATTATTNSPAGPYPIVPSLVDPNSRLVNYSVTTNNGILTITNLPLVADLVVVQSGPTSGIAGSNLVFTVSVTNRGPSVATSVIVSNQLASGFTFVSASASGANNGGVVTWNFVSLPVNGVTNLTVTVFAAEGGAFTNIASGASSVTDTNSANNDGSLANAKSHTIVSALADVAIFKVGETNGYRGSAITYTITATNAGPSTATNVVVQDNLPAGLVLQSASGSYTATASAVTWSGVTLAPGTFTNFSISLVATSTITAFTNIAFSTSPTADPNPTNNNGTSVKSRVTTKVSPSADVVVLLVGPPSAVQGSNFVYTLTITNAGPSTSSNIVVSDSLPLSLLFISASSSGKNTNNVITWPNIKALPVGGSTNYTLTVKAPSGGVFTNIASALAVTFDPNATNNSGVSPASQALTTVAPAQLNFLAGTPVFNPQTGLFEENVTVTNIGSVTILGFRMYVGGLTGGITLYNATGTNNGTPFVDYLFPLDPSNHVTLMLELFSPLRVTPTNSISVEPILPSGIDLSSTNRSVAVSRVFTDTRIEGDTRFVIEFASVPGKTYNIIYSSDLVTWKVATPSVTASANITQWYDDGPPKTESKPASVGARFYRVIKF